VSSKKVREIDTNGMRKCVHRLINGMRKCELKKITEIDTNGMRKCVH
jgi:hypothetical protein